MAGSSRAVEVRQESRANNPLVGSVRRKFGHSNCEYSQRLRARVRVLYFGPSLHVYQYQCQWPNIR